MKKRAASKSGLFLLEMMISILFFSIAAAVCAQVFVKAHLLSRDAVNLNMAAGCASQAAELLAGGSEKEDLQAAFAGASDADGTLCVYYDGEWNLCGAQEAVFVMEIDVKKTGHSRSGTIRVAERQGKEIFALSVNDHIPYTAQAKGAEDE